MKFIFSNFALFLLLFVSPVAHSQEPQGAIELSDLNVLYRGYPNKVTIAATDNNGCEVVIRGTNCSITRPDENKNEYIVRPGNGKSANLSICLVQGDTVTVVRNSRFRVLNLPDPVLYWGAAKSGKKASFNSRLLQAKYPPEIPLKANFQVVSWTVIHKGDTCRGNSSNLHPADSFFKKVDERTDLIFHTTVSGPDGISRTIIGRWSIGPWKEIEKYDYSKPIKGCG